MDTELMGRIEAYVDEVWEDVVADISSLVSHPSIADSSAATAGAPFGEHVRGALDCALSIAERLGYTVGEDEGYVGFADVPGESGQQIATIAHVDVGKVEPV